MTEIVTNFSQRSLATAVKANLYQFFHFMRHSEQAIVRESQHGFNWLTRIPHPWFNGVIATRPPDSEASRMVQETVDYFQANDVAGFTWWPAPELETAVWRQQLQAHGFSFDSNTPGMAMDLTRLPDSAPTPGAIRRVEELQTLTEWSRIFVRGFAMPEAMAPSFLAFFAGLGTSLPLRHYLGYVDGRPVATSTLYLAAGVAGIYNIATVPAARGQGVGSAMTLLPLHEAREMGYRAGILQSSEMGYPVYKRLGFAEVCRMDHFYWQAANAVGGNGRNHKAP